MINIINLIQNFFILVISFLGVFFLGKKHAEKEMEYLETKNENKLLKENAKILKENSITDIDSANSYFAKLRK